MMEQLSGLLGVLLTLTDHLEFEGAQQAEKHTALITESKLTLTQLFPEKKNTTKTKKLYNKMKEQTNTKKSPKTITKTHKK